MERNWVVDVDSTILCFHYAFFNYRRSGNFRQYPTTTKIKNTNIFQHRIIRTKLHFRYAEATKIKQHKNLTDEYFFKQKLPDLQYCYLLHTQPYSTMQMVHPPTLPISSLLPHTHTGPLGRPGLGHSHPRHALPRDRAAQLPPGGLHARLPAPLVPPPPAPRVHREHLLPVQVSNRSSPCY